MTAALMILTGAVLGIILMRSRAEQEEREREDSEDCDPIRPGFDIDEDEDHRLDDPRHGQARDINRRYR